MKTTTIKMVFAIVSLAVLSGCASMGPSATGVSESTYRADKHVSAQHKLHGNVSVKTEGFLNTSRNPHSSRSTANLDNSDAKKAIEKSLSSANLLASSGGEYTLTAEMKDPDLAGVLIGSNRVSKRNIVIKYFLKDKGGSTIYSNVITGSGDRDAPRMGNIWKQQKITSEIAYQDSFRQLIEDLKGL
ncbi:hypothetical protein [Billgrantia endophytica]|uniref:hypothetical protein n=1 Tax=Billgrantia endophytica TaxID=2033802 RepID=UPI0010560C2E|nr:hypothetical protein [Halomonas endophytica]